MYLHGSTASRTLRALASGAAACLTVSLVDGLVLARSAMHHSANYRSVVVYGTPREVTDAAERDEAQRALVEHVVPGRTSEVRMPSGKELKETSIFAVGLEEASAKIRTGPPVDPPDDLDAPVWAGVLPLRTTIGVPEPAPDLRAGIEAPGYATRYRRPSGGSGVTA